MIDFESKTKPVELAERIAFLVDGQSAFEPPNQYVENSWQIGVKNDFSLIVLDDNRYRLSYQHPSPERDSALATLLKWRLGVTNLIISDV